MKKILLPACIVLLFIACNSRPENSPGDLNIDSALAAKLNIPGEPDPSHSSLVGVYEGVLPCGDCGGIKTELTLYQDPANSDNNSYTLKETYLGGKTGDTSFTSNGKWDVLKGIKTDASAAVYFLNYDRPDDSRYFLKKGDTTILMLDKEQNIIQSSLNYTLRKK